MRVLFVLSITSAIAFTACGGPDGDAEELSDQYTEAEIFVNQAKLHVDSIYKSFPKFSELKATDCPVGTCSGMYELLIFEPEEFNVDAPSYSMFRADSTTPFLYLDEYKYFNWYRLSDDQWKMQEQKDRILELQQVKYICIYFNDTSTFIKPDLDSVASSYTGGEASGYAMIMDYNTGKAICTMAVSAKNSENVRYNTYGADTALIHTSELAQMSPAFAIQLDLYENIRQEIYRQINEKNQKSPD